MNNRDLTRILNNLPSEQLMRQIETESLLKTQGINRFTHGSRSDFRGLFNMPKVRSGYTSNFREVLSGAGTSIAEGATSVLKSGTKAAVKSTWRAGKTTVPAAYKTANIASKFFTGASIPQLAIAGGIAGAAFYGLEKALQRDPGQDINTVGNVFKGVAAAASQKTYASRVYQQSTQGLMFGLNSRRTA